MQLTKYLFQALSPLMSNGLFIKLRHAFYEPSKLFNLIRQPKAAPLKPALQSRIVVVGIGTAAHACVQHLFAEQFRSVTIIARDALFGGKCVNAGCMPSEYVLSKGTVTSPEERAQLAAFVEDLRGDVQKQFAATGYPVITGEAARIVGNTLHLTDGRTLDFDRLIVAIGNDYPLSPKLKNLQTIISLDDFWSLPVGTRLSIYADGNITALGLAEVARCLGLIPTILLSGKNPLSALPSFRSFVRALSDGGIRVVDQVQLQHATDQAITVKIKNKSQVIEHEHILVCSQPTPRFLPIDGKPPSIYDLDLVNGCLPSRPDIVFLGDGAGLLTSSESDLQARMIMRAWKYGEKLDFRVFGGMPIRLHAHQSLSMVGPEWSLTASGWREVDFRALGWSKVSGQEGKLWYLLNPDMGTVEAMHICHPHASQLIAIAKALLPYPVWDSCWMAGAVHPSSAEIFKIVADQALKSIPPQRSSQLGQMRLEFDFVLPPLADLDPVLGLPEWLDQGCWMKAILSSNPAQWFAMFYGLAQFEKILHRPIAKILRSISDTLFEVEAEDVIRIENCPELKMCYLRQGEKVVSVDYRES